LQQLHPQQAVVLDPDAKAWHAAAWQNGSRCPSAQMQDVCGKVARKNAGSSTSESSLSRCGQTNFLIRRNIATSKLARGLVLLFDANNRPWFQFSVTFLPELQFNLNYSAFFLYRSSSLSPMGFLDSCQAV
jgi:hypothetical protein